MIVLNQADRLTPAEREQCLADLRRLLDREGLGRVEVLAVSAVTGEGMDVLRARLARQIADKQAAARRLAADVAVAAEALGRASGTTKVTPLDRASGEHADHPGRRGGRGAGGDRGGRPGLAAARWAGHRLAGAGLDREVQARSAAPAAPGPAGRRPEAQGDRPGRRWGVPRCRPPPGCSRPGSTPRCAPWPTRRPPGLTRGWADAIKRAARSAQDALPDRVDRAIATTDLDLAGHRRWWQVVRVLQWLLVAAVVAGLGWLGAAVVLAYLQLPPLPECSGGGCRRRPCW